MSTLRVRLEQMRNELRADLAADVSTLARDLEAKGEDTTPSQHPADVASDLYAREELVADELTLERDLTAVEEALGRIADGTYGVCADCGNEIALERLEARPQALRCISCQRTLDRRARSLSRA
jgi:RNA polymerase-binding transcription factor